jgi:hypothetical protein
MKIGEGDGARVSVQFLHVWGLQAATKLSLMDLLISKVRFYWQIEGFLSAGGWNWLHRKANFW